MYLQLYEEPKLEGTSIQYYKLGKLKDGVEVGITSLSRSIEVSRATKINIVSFGNIEDMAAQFWTLRYCAGDFVLKTHFVDEVASAMIVESFDEDIIMGLNKTYKSRLKDSRAKLWNFPCAKPSKVFSNFDFESEHQDEDVIAGHRARLHMPGDIGNFLKVLNDETLLEDIGQKLNHPHLFFVCFFVDNGNVDLSWLLNNPAFWDEKKRQLWIADLWECVNSPGKETSNVFNRYPAAKHEKWREIVVEGSCWHDVVKRYEVDKVRYGVQNEFRKRILISMECL
ncbi:hypothetical protein RHSIM_Rhsim09G0026000 [Rhododendron simsii]|uniref:Uncharacterized protein n=1 Tax=Rhododendron simsii TaxID=118357 RepID=A0A834LFF0_RHOSS|nr:hypothetical protein RHSIM_Rhsim09G0026000 [Rhododendron simsii]